MRTEDHHRVPSRQYQICRAHSEDSVADRALREPRGPRVCHQIPAGRPPRQGQRVPPHADRRRADAERPEIPVEGLSDCAAHGLPGECPRLLCGAQGRPGLEPGDGAVEVFREERGPAPGVHGETRQRRAHLEENHELKSSQVESSGMVGRGVDARRDKELKHEAQGGGRGEPLSLPRSVERRADKEQGGDIQIERSLPHGRAHH